MTEDTEFGPWQDHDGKGCPCVGQYVQAEAKGWTKKLEGVAGMRDHRDWIWSLAVWPIIRYRVKKPRALLDLIQMIADLPAPTTTPAPGVIA